jgi:hypothetical protein
MLRICPLILAFAIIAPVPGYGALRRVTLLHGNADANVELTAPKGYELLRHRGPDFDTYNLAGPLCVDEAAGVYVGNAPILFWQREAAPQAESIFDTRTAGMRVRVTC